MKKFILLFAFLLGICTLKAGIIEKTYYFSDYKLVKKGEYHFISFENTLIIGKTGEPALPYHSVSLLLPPGHVATSIEMIGEEETNISGNYQLYPRQASRPLSKRNSDIFVKDQDIYNSDAQYPLVLTGEFSTEFLNGYSFVLSTFTPVKYNPAKGKISWYKKVTIRIKTKQDEKAKKALDNLRVSKTIQSRVISLAQNPESFFTYPITDNRTNDDYDMMIITPSSFEESYQGLIDLYLPRGIKAETVTTEYINNNITGQDMPEKIRNYIIQEYQDHGVEYILLGGDIEHVGYRGFYCYVQSGSGYEDNNIPADLYYSALDGTWNDDGDNRWGEIGEDDLLPDVSVARFTISDTVELNNMLHKSIFYQEQPVLGELDQPLLAGEHLWSNPLTWGAQYLELLVGYHDDNGYETTGIPEDDNYDTLYDRSSTWSASQLIAEINEGKSFVHHCGHANTTYVMRLYNSDITNSNFSGVNGVTHNYTLVYTHGCICGSFDYSDCIGEKIVTIDNFAVAGAFNSRYGWFNEGQTEGPSAHLHREFIDALYAQKKGRVGETHKISKIETSPWVNAPGQWEEGALRWCFYDCNMFGDPAMSVWTAEPIDIDVIYQSAIPYSSGSTSLNVTSGGIPVEGLNCVLKNENEIYGTAVTDTNGNAVIYFDPASVTLGPAQIVVSGYNCLPHTYNVTIISDGGPFVIYNSHTINDENGNNNGFIDYGEDILLTVEVNNIGSETANNVDITVSTEDSYITVSDSTENYGNIPAGGLFSVTDGFEFSVANNVPDAHIVNFQIKAEGDSTWISYFKDTINAPLLEIGSLTIDDSETGNGNGILDPGETVEIIIESSNTGHSDCFNALGIFTTDDSYASIADTVFELDTLVPGTTKNAVFSVTIDELTPVGTNIEFAYLLGSGEYLAQNIFNLSVGIVFEDFETGDFTAFDWEFSGNAPWIICNVNPYEGDYCAKSGVIGNSSKSELYITLEVLSDGNISFFRKVSSEADFDYLKFYIDNDLTDKWSGEESWAEVSYAVTSGFHTFKWTYQKDVFVAGGSDCAWVDYIVFPPVSSTTSINEKPDQSLNPNVYPNPCKDKFIIEFSNNDVSDVQISIYNNTGQMIKHISSFVSGKNKVVINTNGLEAGIYYYILRSKNITDSGKIILLR